MCSLFAWMPSSGVAMGLIVRSFLRGLDYNARAAREINHG